MIALDLATAPNRTEIAIVGDPADPRTGALITAGRAQAGPHTAIAAGNPADADGTQAVPLLHDRPLVQDSPAAYVCHNFTCAAPVTEPDALTEALTR